jgi:DNA end-binding protein Ku
VLRAVWSGNITFGLVGIPVKASPVQSPKDVRFQLLHGPCGGKTVIHRFCPQCNREVEDEEMVRGYEHSRGQYLVVPKEDLDSIETPAKHSLQIMDFVDLQDVDPVYYEKPYHLMPGPGGEHTYALLHKAMTDAGRVGIGKVALRDREHLALIRPVKDELVMELLAFPDEVRGLDRPAIPEKVKIAESELKMARLLIDSMSGEFTPEKYQDEYRNAVHDLIEDKLAGGEGHPTPAAPVKSEVGDLMEALRRSVAVRKGTSPEEVEEPKAEASEPKAKDEAPEAEAESPQAEVVIPVDEVPSRVRRRKPAAAARTRAPAQTPRERTASNR